MVVAQIVIADNIVAVRVGGERFERMLNWKFHRPIVVMKLGDFAVVDDIVDIADWSDGFGLRWREGWAVGICLMESDYIVIFVIFVSVFLV